MKKLIFILICLFTSLSVQAQLFDTIKTVSGGSAVTSTNAPGQPISLTNVSDIQFNTLPNDYGTGILNQAFFNSNKKMYVYDSGAITKTEIVNRTITLTNTMTTVQIQAAIDSIGKCIPYGTTVTILFGNGTYNLTNALTFSGFKGEGSLVIKSSDTTQNVYTNQTVILNQTTATLGVIGFFSCDVPILMQNIHIKGISQNGEHLVVVSTCKYVYFYYNYFEGNNYGGGNSTLFQYGSKGDVLYSYYNNIYSAIFCQFNSTVNGRILRSVGNLYIPIISYYGSFVATYDNTCTYSYAARAYGYGGFIVEGSTSYP